ncbi:MULTISPECIES: hypothetical protein [Streptomyces]|uniref:hypothetical protein n=1 Tax=unclassified Streptomyces TaxID=2593676 RepID=UPI0004C78C2A|nr:MULTISPECIES: hypothetical protein [unclassified Streptomyces]MDX2731726.1 hypothetical protein [Streptomyces sp. PA03-2a]MDX3767069.1 hypothetical protein [Streptomyces sp. AK08-01B]MDX3817057.1 hypothetical protein [Streptomyces sp. AK08-01A]WSQ26272.1 hypothetical protein OG763_10870 [Streptomyces sp. NBC_01230]SCZ01439.1 hypothetical protein SAMN02745898_106372 [Streptomyces sp. 136MFCol5.1]
MNPYEGLATVMRSDDSTVRVWAEVSLDENPDDTPGPIDTPRWTARLTAPGGEALLLRGRVTLILDSGSRWPAEVTRSHPSSGPHSPNWTEVRGAGPAVSRTT